MKNALTGCKKRKKEITKMKRKGIRMTNDGLMGCKKERRVREWKKQRKVIKVRITNDRLTGCKKGERKIRTMKRKITNDGLKLRITNDWLTRHKSGRQE